MIHSNGQVPHIVVADHTAAILALMRELLEEAGYRATTVDRTGQDLETILALGPDLIILDYMWPSADNEWVLLNLLRLDPRTRHIPMILCTGAVRQVQPMMARLEQLDVRVVLKPFDIDALLAVVGAALVATPGDRLGAVRVGPETGIAVPALG
jgi:CheY-like chemotaxis protein